jgi:ferritin-like metal-binding protein YciE
MDTKHINEERLEDYILTKVIKKWQSTKDFSDVEHHIAECDGCAERVYQLLKQFRLILNYDVYVDNTSLIKQKLKKSLEKSFQNTNDQTLKSRIQEWLNTFCGHPSHVFKVLMEMPVKGRKLTRLMIENSEKIIGSGELDLDYEAQPLPGRHSEDDQLIRVNRASGRYGDLKTVVGVSKSKKRLIVEFEESETQSPPMLILVPSNPENETRLSKAEWNEQKGKWEIIMSGLNSGTYYTFFEPVKKD